MTGVDDVSRIDVSRETREKLEDLAALILKWTKTINLIAPSTKSQIWQRHIVDSAQIYGFAPEGWQSWTDLGSGGGLPALVIACLDEEKRQITLVESDKRKCLFLSTAKRELSLNIQVINDRIENQCYDKANVVSARALAPLDQLLGFAAESVTEGGTALFPKGATFQEELDQAKQRWQFDLVTHQSQTHAEAKILAFTRIKRRES